MQFSLDDVLETGLINRKLLVVLRLLANLDSDCPKVRLESSYN